MAINDFISNAEISANPATGKVTGDDDPAVTQNGVITKLRDMGTDVNTDLLALATIFDAHNHDPGLGTGGGGQLIGSGGVAAIGAAQITATVINAGAITGGKTASGAVTTAKIADDTVEIDQIGAPETSPSKSGASGSFTFHGASDYVVFHVESDNPVTISNCTSGGFDFANGLGGNVLVRAYGVTSIS